MTEGRAADALSLFLDQNGPFGGRTLLVNPMPPLKAVPGDAVLHWNRLYAQGYAPPAGETEIAAGAGGLFDRALVLGTKQLLETRYYLALAASAVRPGGSVTAAAANDAGGGRLQKEIAALGLAERECFVKHKSRVVTAQKPMDHDNSMLRSAIEAGGPGMNADGFLSRPGLFSWDRIDRGSELLARHIPPSLAGAGADFGCGYGFLARQALRQCRGITHLSLYDVDARALACAAENLSPFAGRFSVFWEDVAGPAFAAGDTKGSDKGAAGAEFDFILTNPPFHTGKDTRASLGLAFIGRAAALLRKGGRLFLVANAHLPYEAAIDDLFTQKSRLADAGGFKILEAVK